MAMSEAEKKEYRRQYYLKNREKMLADQKRRDAKRPEALKEYRQKYYEDNKPRLLERQRIRNRRNYQENKHRHRARIEAWKKANPERYAAITKRHVERTREARIERSRDWYAANKQRASVQSRKARLKRYGLTLEQFDQMLTEQHGRCLICRKTESLVVDHCHTTGKVRGLLCNLCNTALGSFRDSPEILTSAIEYLTRSSSGATSTMSSQQSSEHSASAA